MSDTEFLTDEEVWLLTGFKHPKKQAEHLRRHGVPFIPNAKGRPRVCRTIIRGERAPIKSKPDKPVWQPRAELR